MAEAFHLQVATPERLLVDEQVTEVQLPGKSGYMGVLAGHAPLLSALGAGLLTYQGGGGASHTLALAGGFLEIFENHVRVLADHADFPAGINVDAARRDLDEAFEASKRADSEEASDTAIEAMQRAQARIDAAN